MHPNCKVVTRATIPSRAPKVALAACVLAVGIGGALLFRKAPRAPQASAPSGSTEKSSSAGESGSDPGWAVTHLTGQIAPLVPIARDGDKGAVPANHGEGREAADPPVMSSRFPTNRAMEPIGGRAEWADAAVGEDATSGDRAIADNSGTDNATTHTIRDGDTLSRLAERYLGEGRRYLEIYEYNRDVLPGPDVLPIGAQLRIPPRSGGARPAAEAQPPMVPIRPGLDRQGASAADGKAIYRVLKNDTLARIARHVDGDGRRYMEV